MSSAAQAAKPIPIDALAHDPYIQGPSLSPDGKHMAALTSGPGQPINISVWRTDALNEAPKVFSMGGGATRANVRFLAANWISDERLIVIANQPLTTGSGDDARDFTNLARIVDIERGQWIEPLRRGGTKTDDEAFAAKFLSIAMLDDLPDDPNHILLEYYDFRRGSSDVYKVDIRDGSGERVARAADNESFVSVADRQGRPRVKQFVELKGSEWVIGYRIFDPERNSWEEHSALSYPVKDRRVLSVLDFDPKNPDLLLIADNQGSDLASIKGYDIRKRAFVETLFQHPQYEAVGVVLERAGPTQAPVDIEGFVYGGPTYDVFWADPNSKAVEDALEKLFSGQQVELLDENPDDTLRLIQVSSSKNPPVYYLFKDNRELIKVGDSRPKVNPDDLAATQFVKYKARDGLEIPAFVTLPGGYDKSQGRIPTIVMPHGGPWARDDAGWDASGWVQFLASRGYAVIQPQYRGSDGWGDRLWKAGDREWGQKMQDDNDDAAQYLVDQGIADPQRLALFGYSYGGFAAMAAAARPNSPYQCAISGAGVSDLDWARRTWGENRIQRQMQGDTVGGMNPLANVKNVKIPMLVYSGDRDQTVPIAQSRQWVKALRAQGASIQYFEVPDMPHSLPWWPEWQVQTLTEIERFLAKSCGNLSR